jgi:hypothetical protein
MPSTAPEPSSLALVPIWAGGPAAHPETHEPSIGCLNLRILVSASL